MTGVKSRTTRNRPEKKKKLKNKLDGYDDKRTERICEKKGKERSTMIRKKSINKTEN